MSKLHLHHLENSRSFRILWLLEELDLPYQLTKYERIHGLAPKSLAAIHPLGKAPILQDSTQHTTLTDSSNQSAPKTLVESAHIIEYLLDHYDGLADSQTQSPLQLATHKQFRPDYGSAAYEKYRYWLHFTESSLMPLLIIRLLFATMIQKSPIGIKQVAKLLNKGIEKSYVNHSLEQQLAYLDTHLGKHEWLAGTQFTGADIQLEFAINVMATTNSLDKKYTNIHNWLNKCHNRPAYTVAQTKK